MKKLFMSMLLLMAAIVSAGMLASCSGDDPKPNGEAEEEVKMLPVDSLMGMLEYDYSETAINYLEIKYEVTDFNGKNETFVVTDTGYFQKIYTTTDLSAKAYIKLTVTPKSNLEDIQEDSVSLKFMSYVTDGVYVKGKMLSSFPNYYQNPLFDGKDIKSEFIRLCAELAKEPYTYTIDMPDAFVNGVSEQWFKEHVKQ